MTDGSLVQLVGDDPGAMSGGSCSPDGGRILYHYDPSGHEEGSGRSLDLRLFSIGADGTGKVDLGSGKAANYNDGDGRWSADGKRIVFVTNPNDNFYAATLMTMNADGTGRAALGISGYIPYWSNHAFMDTDQDAIPQIGDNCPAVWNPAQGDLDGDGVGDACDPDQDGDGQEPATAGGTDCDDRSFLVHPGASDLCLNGVDEDCDGLIDEDCTVEEFTTWSTSVWEGHRWCYNVDQGAWTGQIDSGRLVFTPNDYCWNQARTVGSVVAKGASVHVDVTPMLQSGGTNVDEMYVALGTDWAIYGGGALVGVLFRGATREILAWRSADSVTAPIGSFVPGTTIGVDLAWQNDGSLVLSGTGISRTVIRAAVLNQDALRVVMTSGGNTDLVTVERVAFGSPGTPAP